MAMISRLLILCSLIATASADTVELLVGNTGCRTRQLAIQRLWKSMPGVQKVEIRPRKSGEPANQRVFLVTTDGPAPDQKAFTIALGRKATRYPILSLTPSTPTSQ